jgi:hypothetical protein
MSAYRVIDKLDSVIREGLWMPFGWRAVNADRVHDLIEKLRSTLPDDAGRVRSEARPADAPRDAASAAGPAGDDVKSKAAESDVLAKAQARADEIVEQAQRAARDIRRGADEYADQVLASLDGSLGKALAAVQKGRQALAQPGASNGKPAKEMSAT